MATMSSSHTDRTGKTGEEADCRIAAFCSRRFPDLFHAFAYANDIWRHDVFDVEAIHQGAREKFQQIVGRVVAPSGLGTGRLLLLLGEAGCGKTHLMRAFRNKVHSGGSGYCAYLQMTAFSGQYGRYVLNNLIDSLDKPYNETQSPTSGLLRLSNALVATYPDVAHEKLEQLRNGAMDQPDIDRLVQELADTIILDDRFNTIDVFLVQALLYLERNDPRTKARVLKYLRCEDLSEHDQRFLGGIIPCTYSDAPHRMVERVGQLIWAVERVPLILCVDQLEDVFDLEEAPIKFRRAMATLCDIVSRLRSAIVVIACLDNFYDELKKLLTRPIVDRVEQDPPPVGLRSPCNPDEVEKLIGQRLRFLYESLGVPYQPEQPSYPLPVSLVHKLTGLRPRDVLSEVQLYRECCIEKGKMADYPFEGICHSDSMPRLVVTPLEQAWNEFRSTFGVIVPVDEAELATILSNAIQSCSDEVESGERFEVEANGRLLAVERHSFDQSVECCLVGICNRGAQGGGLGRQIDEVVRQAGEHTPIVVRSTEFPTNPKAAVSQQLREIVVGGGRYVVIQDADWRVMTAMSRFRQQYGTDPSFRSWLKLTHPLSSLASLRMILDLPDGWR
jgi:hypothetical protein